VDLNEPVLRKAATGKLAHAFDLANALSADMNAWWDMNPVSLVQEVRADDQTVDFFMHTSPLPPEDWCNRLSDVLQNFRNALNRLTKTIGFEFAKPDQAGDGNFPIHDAEIGWQHWRKKHPEFPDEVAERFRAFEPFVSGRPFLLALRNFNNLEKHDLGFTTTVTMTKFEAKGTFTVEGLWEDDNLGDQLKVISGETLDIESERQLIGTVEWPTRIIGVKEALEGAVSDFAFTPMLRFDSEELPLGVVLDGIGREVTWAIAYITGQVTDAVNPPSHFDL
jgi:hypothetical protein